MLSQGFDIFGIHIQYWMLLAAIVTISVGEINWARSPLRVGSFSSKLHQWIPCCSAA